jgi:hypothetical protein
MSYLMDEDEYLAHYGVPGMKWGHRKGARNVPMGPSRKHLRNLNKQARAENKVANKQAANRLDKDIAARRAKLPEQKAQLKQARAKFNIEKKQIGRVAAYRALEKAEIKYDQQFAMASRKTQKEQTKDLVNGIAGAVVVGTLKALR